MAGVCIGVIGDDRILEPIPESAAKCALRPECPAGRGGPAVAVYSIVRSAPIIAGRSTMTIIELERGLVRVRVAPELGGSIAAFTFDGRPVLRTTPGAALAGRDVRLAACYPLIPYSNRIRDARLRFDGRDHALARNFGAEPHAIHGVGWQRPWSIAEASRDHARLALDHDARAESAAAWPWPFHAVQTFRLAEAAGGAAIVLTATLTIVNTGTAPFPFGLGFHPFFVKDDATQLGFAAETVWRNDATLLPQQQVAIPPEWRFDPPRPLGAIAIDNVFPGWRGAATLVGAAGATTALAADRALGYLVLYAPPGSGFIAVEPVTHETDAFNRAAAGAPGTGMRILPPGRAFSCTMRIAAAGPASLPNTAS